MIASTSAPNILGMALGLFTLAMNHMSNNTVSNDVSLIRVIIRWG
jgi:hypothetical protein